MGSRHKTHWSLVAEWCIVGLGSVVLDVCVSLSCACVAELTVNWNQSKSQSGDQRESRVSHIISFKTLSFLSSEGSR